jgi:hypothetical protein
VELGGLEDGLKLARVLVALAEGIIYVNVLGRVGQLVVELLADGVRGFLLGAIVLLQALIG